MISKGGAEQKLVYAAQQQYTSLGPGTPSDSTSVTSTIPDPRLYRRFRYRAGPGPSPGPGFLRGSSKDVIGYSIAWAKLGLKQI